MMEEHPVIKLSQNTLDGIDSISWERSLTPEQVQSKTRIMEWDAWNGYITGGLLLLSGIIFSVLSVSFCISVIKNPLTSSEDKKWAMSYLSLFGGGVIGYLTGKSKS